MNLDDVCVDYGCGTLRVGVQIISQLRPGAYWGLDIADLFLEEGRRLIGEKLWLEKRPNLRVISPETVAETARAKPANLFSTAVFFHVHPDELSEYIENVMTIIRPAGGQAFIEGKWTENETIQYTGRSWSHNLSIVRELVRVRGGELTILDEREHVLGSVDRVSKRGMLRITIG